MISTSKIVQNCTISRPRIATCTNERDLRPAGPRPHGRQRRHRRRRARPHCPRRRGAHPRRGARRAATAAHRARPAHVVPHPRRRRAGGRRRRPHRRARRGARPRRRVGQRQERDDAVGAAPRRRPRPHRQRQHRLRRHRRARASAQSALRQIRGNRISMVFQQPNASLHPCYTRRARRSARCTRSTRTPAGRPASSRPIEMLRRVGIPDPRRAGRSRTPTSCRAGRRNG